MKSGTCVAFLVLGVLVAGCGKEVGRVPFSGPGSAARRMTLGAGKVSFWTNLDIHYKGDVDMVYKVALVQRGKTVAAATCDPLGHLDIRIGWVQTDIGASHSRRGTGRMECSARVPTAGPTVVKATLAFLGRPAKVDLEKADLIVKQ